MWRWNPIDSPPAPWVVEAGRCQKHIIRVTLNGDFMGFHGILYGILWGFMLCFKFCVKLSMRIYVILLLIYPPDFSKMAIGNQQVEEVNDANHLQMGLFALPCLIRLHDAWSTSRFRHAAIGPGPSIIDLIGQVLNLPTHIFHELQIFPDSGATVASWAYYNILFTINYTNHIWRVYIYIIDNSTWSGEPICLGKVWSKEADLLTTVRSTPEHRQAPLAPPPGVFFLVVSDLFFQCARFNVPFSCPCDSSYSCNMCVAENLFFSGCILGKRSFRL